MKHEDRQLLSDQARVNTVFPAFAGRVMDNTATRAEHYAVADRVITLGQTIGHQAETLTVLNAEPDNAAGADGTNVAATRALSALVNMAGALRRTHGSLSACLSCGTLPVDWSG